MGEIKIRQQAQYPDGHFYSPVVDTADVAAREGEIWPANPQTPGLDWNHDSHRRILAEWFPRYMPEWDYPEVLKDGPELDRFYVRNPQFSWLDCRTLYVMLRELRPRRVVEVGSGYSSLLMADVNRRFLDGATDITCIEPYPREILQRGLPGIARLQESRVERLGLDAFAGLAAGDVLFIDSSHVAKTGSDVNFLVFEVLPRLPAGVWVHFHDIHLPQDYMRQWVIEENRSWNEQYVVRALLMHSTGFRIMFGCNYAYLTFPELVSGALAHPRGFALSGGSLWIRRE